MPRSIDISREPKGRTYITLVDYLGRRCPTFSLVWRKQVSLSDLATMIAHQLRPFLVREERADEGQVVGRLATTRHYRSVKGSLNVLKYQMSLYSWAAPTLPENLTFYDDYGVRVFWSDLHERNAWFNLDVLTTDAIRTEIQGIELDDSSALQTYGNPPRQQSGKGTNFNGPVAGLSET